MLVVIMADGVCEQCRAAIEQVQADLQVRLDGFLTDEERFDLVFEAEVEIDRLYEEFS